MQGCLEACGYAKHFVDRRQSGPALRDAVLDHRAHPLAARDVLEVGGFGLWPDRLSHRRRNHHHLEQPLASAKSAEAAPLTAASAVNGFACLESEGRETLVAGKIGSGKSIGNLAVLAQHPHQTLT